MDPFCVMAAFAVGSGGHKGGKRCGGGKHGRRCTRVHPGYGAVVKDGDVGVFVGASNEVFTRGKNVFSVCSAVHPQKNIACVAAEMGPERKGSTLCSDVLVGIQRVFVCTAVRRSNRTECL